MNIKRFGSTAALAVAGTLLLASCAAGDNGGSEGDGSLSGTLVGAGASAQGSAQEAWTAGFQNANDNATVEYDPVGSGGGRDSFRAGDTQFAGTDRAFNDKEIAEDAFGACVPGTDIIELPAYISPIAVIFNLDGVDELQLDGKTLAGIFANTITRWNDPAIADQNEGVDLPDSTITVTYRGDDSGTSANFTEYLDAVAPDVWTYGSIEEFPNDLQGVRANQTSGMVESVTTTVGSIGYADASRAGGLGTVAVKVGDEYVPYSPEAAAAIVDASPRVEGRTEFDMAIALERDTTAAGVYPIVLISYIVACTEYAEGHPVDLVKGYLEYVISEDGQKAAADHAGSAPISSTLRADAERAVAAIK